MKSSETWHGPADRIHSKAEDTGLIVPIGDWVLREACRQNKAWQDAGLPPMVVSVNVSARQFQERKSSPASPRPEGQRAGGQISGAGSYRELDYARRRLAVETMKALQSLGSDFQSTTSAPAIRASVRSRAFPVARLKIDKSFVDDLPHDESGQAVAPR